jgi:hypothetical protein
MVVWIGGGTGSGKTTVTRLLAGRHGLRVFPVDAFWYSHLARRPEPEPDPDAQWLGASPAAQAREFEALTRRRWSLILDDLAALPGRPPTVVEGPQVLPDLIPSGHEAVFLVPTPAFQRSVLQRRPLPATADPAAALANRVEKDRLHGARVASLARERGFPLIAVDGTRPPASVLAAVEAALPGVRRAAPGTVAEVREARRWENAVAANIRSWLATAHVPPEKINKYPFACECGAPGCVAIVDVAADEMGTEAIAFGH